MTDPTKIEYPQAHPHYNELNVLKMEIDALYEAVMKEKEVAREMYRQAYDNLARMGKSHEKQQELLKAMVDKFKELEIVVTKPLF